MSFSFILSPSISPMTFSNKILMKFSFRFSAKSDNNFIIIFFTSKSPLCVQSQINLMSSSFT